MHGGTGGKCGSPPPSLNPFAFLDPFSPYDFQQCWALKWRVRMSKLLLPRRGPRHPPPHPTPDLFPFRHGPFPRQHLGLVIVGGVKRPRETVFGSQTLHRRTFSQGLDSVRASSLVCPVWGPGGSGCLGVDTAIAPCLAPASELVSCESSDFLEKHV